MTKKETATAIRVRDVQPNIAIVEMDLPGSNANILNDQLFKELDETMAELAERKELDGVILKSAKPKIFVAGADLNKIVATLDWPDEEIIRFCEKGRAVMARFSRCPFVSVAAIHGACVGGGLELALWCDCRIATSDRRTVLGLPEVKLGLVPGWAGTARLPRIAGIKHAMDLVTSGRLVSAADGKEMGFVDAVVEEEKLVEEAVAMIGRVRTSESFVRDRRAIMGPVSDVGDLEKAVYELGTKIVENEDVFPFAPTVALEHMARTAGGSIKEAWDSESLAMAQVYGSPASRGLLNHFFLVDRNKKQPGLVDLELTPIPIKSIGIVGAGVMGRLIAQDCLKNGIDVVIFDAVKGLADSVADELGPKNDRATITATSGYEGLGQVPLVIESVVETVDVKKIVLKKIESVVDKKTLIASNTSAIPIEKMAGSLKHPRNFCGIHFCHPELMSLVEVIAGPSSSEQAIANAVGFVKGLRKMPVAMNDGPGFVVNRLLGAMIDQAINLFCEGFEIETIDQAMREFGFRGGPFEILDIVGVDTCMYAGRTMWESGLKCVGLTPVLPKMVKMNRIGRKTGKGFYHYPDPAGEPVWNDDVLELIGDYRNNSASHGSLDETNVGKTKAEKTQSAIHSEIVNSILSVVALEATRILDEEIVADHRDIDLCIIHGFSFPPHRGGILFWADQIGWKRVEEILADLGSKQERLLPSAIIKKMADRGDVFYSGTTE